MDNGIQLPVVMATFASHSGAYLSPEMYKDEYEDALLEIADRKRADNNEPMFVVDTLRHTHMVDLNNLAYVASQDVPLMQNVNYTVEVDIDDYDDWE